MLASGRNLYVTRESVLIPLLERSPIAAQRKLIENTIKNDNFFELRRGVPDELRRKVMNREAAFLGFPAPSNLMLSKEVVIATKVAYIVNKDRPWKRDFDLPLERLKAHGFFVKFLRDSLQKMSKEEYDSTAGKPLKLLHFRSSLYVFVGGMALAQCAYFAERLRLLS